MSGSFYKRHRDNIRPRTSELRFFVRIFFFAIFTFRIEFLLFANKKEDSFQKYVTVFTPYWAKFQLMLRDAEAFSRYFEKQRSHSAIIHHYSGTCRKKVSKHRAPKSELKLKLKLTHKPSSLSIKTRHWGAKKPGRYTSHSLGVQFIVIRGVPFFHAVPAFVGVQENRGGPIL